MLRLLFALITSFSGATWADAETIDVKYYGKLDLAPFACTEVTRSSFYQPCLLRQSKSVHGRAAEDSLLPVLRDASRDLSNFLDAPSMGQYYNANIKGTGSDGPFDCRTHRVPKYRDAGR